MKKIILFLSSILLIGCGSFTVLVDKGSNWEYKIGDGAWVKGFDTDDAENADKDKKCNEFSAGILSIGADKVKWRYGSTGEGTDLAVDNYTVAADASDAPKKADNRCTEEDEKKADLVTLKVEGDNWKVNGEAQADGSCIKSDEKATVSRDAREAKAAVAAQAAVAANPTATPPVEAKAAVEAQAAVTAIATVEAQEVEGNKVLKADGSIADADSACE